MSHGSAADLEIKRLDEGSAMRWDAFVDACPEATFFHRSGWQRVIEQSFGHKCYYLYVESEGRLRGVLPLAHVNSRIFANALVSNGFCVYGGPAARDDEARSALDKAAMALARELNVDYLEYRRRSPSHPDWHCDAKLYATFRKPLAPDPRNNFAAIPRKRRAEIRKGIKLGLQSDPGPDVDRFYRIYAESLRNLGTPVFGKQYFRNLKSVFGEACEVLTVTHKGRPVSSVLSFYFRDEVLPYYGGGVAAARGLSANDFMYWELMRRACERGIGLFDFGRSKRGTGAFSYKKNWGFEPEALYHEYKLLRRPAPPAINPLNPRYRAFIAIWRRLPLWAANLIGPRIARDLG